MSLRKPYAEGSVSAIANAGIGDSDVGDMAMEAVEQRFGKTSYPVEVSPTMASPIIRLVITH